MLGPEPQLKYVQPQTSAVRQPNGALPKITLEFKVSKQFDSTTNNFYEGKPTAQRHTKSLNSARKHSEFQLSHFSTEFEIFSIKQDNA